MKIITLAALAAVPVVAVAQEFRGAELSAEVLGFSEDDGPINQTTYRGSLEGGIGPFGVAADLSFYALDGDDVRGLTLHVIYDGLDVATLGAFYARETIDGEAADTIGLEAARSFGALDAQGYVAFSEDDAVDVRLFGLDGRVDLSSSLSLTGQADLLDGDGGAFSRVAVGGEYRLASGPAFYAEVGRLGSSDDDLGDSSNTFFGIGARIAIGPRGGTTFDPRGAVETLSGF